MDFVFYAVMTVVGLLLGFVVLAVLYMILEAIVGYFIPWGKPYEMKATVKSMSHRNAETHTGVGPAIGGNGGVAVTTSYSPESWDVIFVLENGDKWDEDDERLWDDLNVGDHVTLTFHSKKVFGNKKTELVAYEKDNVRRKHARRK